jgi:hypothetical protein
MQKEYRRFGDGVERVPGSKCEDVQMCRGEDVKVWKWRGLEVLEGAEKHKPQAILLVACYCKAYGKVFYSIIIVLVVLSASVNILIL